MYANILIRFVQWCDMQRQRSNMSALGISLEVPNIADN